MKQQHIVILAVSLILLGTTAFLLKWEVPRLDSTGQMDAPNMNADVTKPPHEQFVENASSPNGQENEPDRFFAQVGPMRYRLELDRKTVFQRIVAAKAVMDVQTQILPDTRVEGIMNAYNRLMKGAIFLSGTEPTWGVEDSEYFFFSGRRLRQLSTDAFLYGYAVKKDNGRVYRWVPQEDPK